MQSILIATNNKVTNLSSNKLAFTNMLASGLFNGSVAVPGVKRSLGFYGAFLQKRDRGYGHFRDTNRTGRVFLGP